jgi:hypothetical protein
MSPLNVAIYNNKLHIMSWMILIKKQLFDLIIALVSYLYFLKYSCSLVLDYN